MAFDVAVAGGEVVVVVTMLLNGGRSLVKDFETNSVSCSMVRRRKSFEVKFLSSKVFEVFGRGACWARVSQMHRLNLFCNNLKSGKEDEEGTSHARSHSEHVQSIRRVRSDRNEREREREREREKREEDSSRGRRRTVLKAGLARSQSKRGRKKLQLPFDRN